MLHFFEESSLIIGIPVITLLFFFRRNKENGNIYLALSLLSMWYALFINRLNVSQEILSYPFLFRTGNIAAYLIFSFLYLYTRKTFYPGRKFHKIDLLFFAPAIFYVVDMVPFFLSDPDFKIAVMKANFNDPARMQKVAEGWVGIKGFHFIFRYLWGVFLMGLQIRLILRNRAPGPKSDQPWNRSLYLFIITLTALYLPLIIPGIFGVIFHLKWYTLIFINIDASLTILTVALFILFSPRILYGFYPLPATDKGNDWSHAPLSLTDLAHDIPSLEQKDHRIYMDDEETAALLEKINSHMRDNRPYLNREYSIHDLSRDTQIPVYQLSPIINQFFSSNFRSWLNKFRVEHFIENSRKPGKSDLTIDALAEESGFSNRATFINAFKKEMGTTPGLFVKKQAVSSQFFR
jgi:AraC-like DNA-binding protein